MAEVVRAPMPARRWYRTIRSWLLGYPLAFRTIQVARFIVLLGPTYRVNKRLWPRLRFEAAVDPWPASSTVIDLVPEADRLRRDGFTAGPRVRPAALRALQEWCSEAPVHLGKGMRGEPMPHPPRALEPGKRTYHYTNPSETGPPAMAIVTEPGVLRLIGSYFDAEPVLARLLMYWSIPDPDRPESRPSQFHYDTNGPQSAMLLCYVSDVGPEHGAHTIISGSHGRKPLSHLMRRRLSAAEAETRFGDRVHAVQGPAGTMVIEDPSILHSHRPATAPRLVIMATYIPQGRRA